MRSANDQLYSDLQENISVGIVTDTMKDKLSERVTKCDTENDNEWYRDGKQVMITSTHDIKDKFNMKQLPQLHGDIIEFPAKDIPSKGLEQFPDLTNVPANKTKGLISKLQIKKQCPIKMTVNVNKKDSLVNGTFGYVLDFDEVNEVIWCIFSRNTGNFTRKNYDKKHPRNQNAVPIFRVREQVTVTMNGLKFIFRRTQIM